MKGLAILLAVLVASVVAFSSTARAKNPFDTTVFVSNGMKPESGPVAVHCQSGDDDLGQRQLAVGQEFDWTFGENFWGTTKFYCTFNWNAKRVQMDVYNGKIDSDGYKLYYAATEAGITHKSERFDWRLVAPWNPASVATAGSDRANSHRR